MGSFSTPLPSLFWNFSSILTSHSWIRSLSSIVTQSLISYSFSKTRQWKSITHNALQHNKLSIVGVHQYGVIEYCLSEYVTLRWLHNLLSYLNDRDVLGEQRAKSRSLKCIVGCNRCEWHLMRVSEWRDRGIWTKKAIVMDTHTYTMRN